MSFRANIPCDVVLVNDADNCLCVRGRMRDGQLFQWDEATQTFVQPAKFPIPNGTQFTVDTIVYEFDELTQRFNTV